MSLFQQPQGLKLVAHFSVPAALTWGNSKLDAEFKEQLRQASGLLAGGGETYEWYIFSIHIGVARGRRKPRQHGPDIENFPKLIVDAFTGVLYSDDDLDHVRGVQVEGDWVDDDQQCTEIWIWGMTRE